MVEPVLISLPKHDLAALIIDCVNTCLQLNQKAHNLATPADQFLNIHQAAEFVGLSVPTIYGLVSKGSIPCMKKGKRLYFLEHELGEWIRGGRKITQSELSKETDDFLVNKKRR